MDLETQVAPDAATQNPAPDAVEAELTAPQAEATEQATESTESEESKALKRMQRRIDKRTADVYRERAQNEQLAQRIAQLEARQEPQEEQSYQPAQIEEAVRRQAREIAHTERINEKCNSIAQEGNKAFPNFTDALQTLAAETGPLFDQRGRPTALMNVILESEKPAKLLHHLGTNPDLAAELSDLTPTQLARKLDRIEREMTVQPTKSSAPKPLTPTKGAARNSDPSDDEPYAVWAVKEAARMNAKRGMTARG